MKAKVCMAGIARLHEQAQDRALAVHGAPHLDFDASIKPSCCEKRFAQLEIAGAIDQAAGEPFDSFPPGPADRMGAYRSRNA